jgi:hypothetical protein
MNHFATPDFWYCYRHLPKAIRELADEKFELLRRRSSTVGYDLYITRARHTWECTTNPIPRTEWGRVVDADASLRRSSEDWFARRIKGGAVERINAVIWIEHPDQVAFWFVDGAISTKNPDPATIEKMIDLADKLNARVIGEGNEEYQEGGEIISPAE